MKFICLGYLDEKNWDAMSEAERNTLMDACFAYDDVLRADGHFAGGEALQSHRTAATLRYGNGKVSVTDGPYAETKEQLGGILILEATDLKHAIELMSKHPGVKAGPFESVRPRTSPRSSVRAPSGGARRRRDGDGAEDHPQPVVRSPGRGGGEVLKKLDIAALRRAYDQK